MFQAVKGTQELLPAQLYAYRNMESTALKVAEQYGFAELRTALFEKSEIYTKGLGSLAGLVERELWSFQDKHGQKLSLRADVTPSVVRAYHQHKMSKDGPHRFFYLGPVFLLGKEGESPSRQSQQFGVEVLGNDLPAVEVELMSMALDFAERLELPELKLEINSLGSQACRPAYYDALREFFASRQSELCSNCRRKYRNHPTWVLSCPEKGCQMLSNLCPTILGYLCEDSKAHFHALKQMLQELEMEVTFNHRVVRDLEYYDGTVFRLLSQDRTVAVGGRYDGLSKQLGFPDTPGAGFAFNLDEAAALLSPPESEPEAFDFLFLPEGPEASKALLPIALKLRKSGARVDFVYPGTPQPNETTQESRWQIRLQESNSLRGQVEIIDQQSRQQEKTSTDRLLSRLTYLFGQAPSEESRSGRRRLSRLRKDRDRDRERDSRRTEEAPSAVEVEKVEQIENDEQGSEDSNDESRSRRRRRRRRRGEGEAEDPPVGRERDRERERDEAPPTRTERAPAAEPTRRPPEPPAKAFIPSLVLGGVNLAPKKPPVKVVEESPKSQVLVGATSAPAGSGGLNWSLKKSAPSPIEEASETVEETSAPRRRTARRR
jgi:histidyl-tRNA synthetase